MLNVKTKQQTIIDTSCYRVNDIVRINLSCNNGYKLTGYGTIENINTEYIAITPDYTTKNNRPFKTFYDSGNDLLYFYINKKYDSEIEIKSIYEME